MMDGRDVRLSKGQASNGIVMPGWYYLRDAVVTSTCGNPLGGLRAKMS
jgi:hypothetical protein